MISIDDENRLFHGINEEAMRAKGLPPMQLFGFVEKEDDNLLAGLKGLLLYGCLYVDSLFVESAYRKKGLGRRLMQKAEAFGREQGCTFATVNTMDWEALSFYQKLGYEIEFVREGFTKESKMYFLRKLL